MAVEAEPRAGSRRRRQDPVARHRRRPSRLGLSSGRVRHYGVIVLLVLFSLFMLAPLVWTLSTSLRPAAESFSLPPKWIPTDFAWQNYVAVFETIALGRYIANSLIVALAVVAGQLFTASLAGYAFARLEFPFRGVLFALVLATMMVPLQVTIIPVFLLISEVDLADTLTGLIVPAWPTAFGTFLLRQYFLGVPKELDDAAVIDGANQWQIFLRMYVPLAAPGLAVVGILAFNYHWNEFFRPLIFLASDENFTLPLGLVNLQGYLATGSIALLLAGVVISLVPVLLIFMFGQRYVMEGLMRGGLKG